MTSTEATISPRLYLQAQTRWRPAEIVFWLATLLPYLLFPDYLSLASQIAITGLFAMSLDLILGYAGVVSLGHAAFFGLGAYTAGIVSKAGWGEPLSGLVLAALVAGGNDGLQGVHTWPLFGRIEFDFYGHAGYGYSLAVVFLVFLAARRLTHS